jgi:hypothetical protein
MLPESVTACEPLLVIETSHSSSVNPFKMTPSPTTVEMNASENESNDAKESNPTSSLENVRVVACVSNFPVPSWYGK